MPSEQANTPVPAWRCKPPFRLRTVSSRSTNCTAFSSAMATHSCIDTSTCCPCPPPSSQLHSAIKDPTAANCAAAR
ncbi:hypothetical protein D3C71_1367440 [compost metagenome]